MLIAIIGENCVGKSTLANKINEKFKGKIYSGKDYLRLEKSPTLAETSFKKLLNGAVDGENVIYIITEKEHLVFLPEKAFKIVVTADIDTIKARFKERMRGILPPPVEKMLEQNHDKFDNLKCDIKLEPNYNIEKIFKQLNINWHNK